MEAEAITVLREKFGKPDFLGNQLDIIKSNLQNVNVFVLKNTGGGKSLTFQLAAALSDGAYVIISPLIALINDHCNSLSDSSVSEYNKNSK